MPTFTFPDRQTGECHTDSPLPVISASTTRSQATAALGLTPTAKSDASSDVPTPRRSYRLPGEWTIMATPCLVQLHFFDERLVAVSISILSEAEARFFRDNPSGLLSWDSWSESKEVESNRIQQELLSRTYGNPDETTYPIPGVRYVFSWGEISAYYDARSAESTTSIRPPLQ